MARGIILRRYAEPSATALLAAVELITHRSPFRRMITPGGQTMSVAMTNCGELGWVTDRKGYRYQATDPLSSNPWPQMPDAFAALASAAAAAAGYSRFSPDACLMNRYVPGTRLTLHQDKDEQITPRPSSQSRWDCRPSSCSADFNALIARAGSCSTTAMSSCGADHPGSSTTASIS